MLVLKSILNLVFVLEVHIQLPPQMHLLEADWKAEHSGLEPTLCHGMSMLQAGSYSAVLRADPVVPLVL